LAKFAPCAFLLRTLSFIKYFCESLTEHVLIKANQTLKEGLLQRRVECSNVMAMAITIGEEFDGISEIYDETRQAATPAELKALSSELKDCHTILDVGVGTGRFAKPLSECGFDIVGIDLSRKMILKAKLKGLHNLILADACNMPFRDGAFDGSIIIHVFHLLPDWLTVVREMGRVTNKKVAALLSNRPGAWSNTANVSGDAVSPAHSEIWVQYAKLRAEAGYPMQRHARRWQNEADVRSKLPPNKLIEVSNEVEVLRVSDLMQRFLQRSPSWHMDIPVEVHQKIMQQLLASTDNKQITRTVTEQLAIWQPDMLRSL
jgi:ubiquinone/menaquinone biosynthesis C-methylase UbiE